MTHGNSHTDSCLLRTVLRLVIYLNVTTLRLGIFYRKSVCLSSVTLVRPTQPVEILGDVSMLFCTLGIR